MDLSNIKYPDKLKISNEDISTLFKNKFTLTGDGCVMDNEGNIFANDLQSGIDKFIDQKNFIDTGNPNQLKEGKFQNVDQFVRYCEANDIAPLSDQAMKILEANKSADYKYK